MTDIAQLPDQDSQNGASKDAETDYTSSSSDYVSAMIAWVTTPLMLTIGVAIGRSRNSKA